IKTIINSHSPGLPIGNLTSQLFANIYLNELDKFVKHTLRLKYYLRYMDDFLILVYNKQQAHQLKTQIQDFLQERLKLQFNPKRLIISPATKGIDFLGYLVFPNYCLLRKSTVKRYIKKTKAKIKKSGPKFLSSPEFRTSWVSWAGYAKFAKSWHLRKNILQLFQRYK
ncbi:MAG: RNA-directed DNA polymerase, partial [Candidatus Parcubacteria bacterium]|nr:RNA-directed DNA polymerase [Candidatus Parcubacteria bacterium]